MSLYTLVDSAPVALAPTGTAYHKRVTVTDTAGFLGTFISGGLPYLTSPTNTDVKIWPKAVNLGVEVASGANTVYVTFDGQSTPSATLGFIVPTLPNYIRVPCPDGLTLDKINLVASANPTYVQLYAEFGG